MKKLGSLVLAALAVCGLVACGDSGGGGTTPAVGSFVLGSISADEDGVTGPYAETGLYEVAFNAGGAFSYNTVVTSGTPESGSGSYVNNGDGSLTADGMDFFLSADGELIGTMTTDGPGAYNQIMLGAKKGSSLSAAILDGDYTLFMFGDNSGSFVFVADMLFDGAASEVLIPDVDAVNPFAYTVSATGLLEIPGVDFTGQVAADGRVAVIVDAEIDNSSDILLAVMVKRVSDIGAAPSGNFLALQFMDDDMGGTGNRMAGAGLVTFGDLTAGEGTLDYVDLVNAADSQMDIPYTFDETEGLLTIDPDGVTIGGPIFGYVTPDGRVFVTLDDDDSDEAIDMMVGMKI